MQHLISVGSLGQYPLCEVPPLLLQDVVLIHTPGVPPTLHGPLRAASTTAAVTKSREITKSCMITGVKNMSNLSSGFI